MNGSPRRFVIARNPDPDSRLPYLLRLPLAEAEEWTYRWLGAALAELG